MKPKTLKPKKLLGVFYTTSQAPLKLSQLLVYSYRAYQSEYVGVPSRYKVVKATGLSKQTVKAADKALYEKGLLDAHLTPQVPPPGWFVQKKDPPASVLFQRIWHKTGANLSNGLRAG